MCCSDKHNSFCTACPFKGEGRHARTCELGKFGSTSPCTGGNSHNPARRWRSTATTRQGRQPRFVHPSVSGVGWTVTACPFRRTEWVRSTATTRQGRQPRFVYPSVSGVGWTVTACPFRRTEYRVRSTATTRQGRQPRFVHPSVSGVGWTVHSLPILAYRMGSQNYAHPGIQDGYSPIKKNETLSTVCASYSNRRQSTQISIHAKVQGGSTLMH
jgi:hypothetical protein